VIHFWRDTSFSGSEFTLVDELEIAHRRSAMRSNASTVALKNAAGGSGCLEMALAAALLTLGGRHAPIPKIYRLLDQPVSKLLETVEERLCNKEKIEGWGNSFFKFQPDPDWVKVHQAIVENFPEMAQKLNGVTELLDAYKKKIHPNAGAYTAATAIILGIPAEISSYLLISARLPVWADLAQKAM
jgi:citrate synthase